MSRSYPIWVDITARTYQSDKFYGIKATGIQKIRVGSSASNSHLFGTVQIKKRVRSDEVGELIIFSYYFDDVKLKTATFRGKNGRATELLSMENAESLINT